MRFSDRFWITLGKALKWPTPKPKKKHKDKK